MMLHCITPSTRLSICCVLQIRAQSENDADDELLSVAVVKGDRKVVAGTQSGVVNLYSWGHMDDCSDRFPGVHTLAFAPYLLAALLLLLLRICSCSAACCLALVFCWLRSWQASTAMLM